MDTNLTLSGATPDMLWTTLVTVVVICGVLVTVLTLIEKVQKLRTTNSKPQDNILDMLKNDKNRLDAHEAAISEIRVKQRSLEEGQRAVCAGVMALLEHELHNGNSTQMEQASADINRYLLNK